MWGFGWTTFKCLIPLLYWLLNRVVLIICLWKKSPNPHITGWFNFILPKKNQPKEPSPTTTINSSRCRAEFVGAKVQTCWREAFQRRKSNWRCMPRSVLCRRKARVASRPGTKQKNHNVRVFVFRIFEGFAMFFFFQVRRIKKDTRSRARCDFPANNPLYTPVHR